MMRKKLLKYLLLIAGMMMVVKVSAQSIKDVRINEIQVYNTNGLMDEYGLYGSWIELFNTGYGRVNVGGCYLKVNGKEYHIPQGDPGTVVHTRGYAVFYAGGISERGTFYTNFTLDNTDFIEFYDVDHNLIDRFEFNPADMKPDVSYGWIDTGNGKEVVMNLPAITPRANNNTEEKIERAEVFRQADPIGFVLTITSIFVVAIALLLLFLIFKYMGDFHVKNAQKKKARQNQPSIVSKEKVKPSVLTTEELAAISIALYKYSINLHDEEHTILTINRAAKVYSPWSSKIHTLTQTPNKK